MLFPPLLFPWLALLVAARSSSVRTTTSLAAAPRVHMIGAGLHLGHLTRDACAVLAEADIVLHDDLGKEARAAQEVRVLAQPNELVNQSVHDYSNRAAASNRTPPLRVHA